MICYYCMTIHVRMDWETCENLDSGTPGAWKLFEFDYESFVEQYLIIEGVSMVEDFGSVLLYHGPVDEDGFIDLTSGSSADTYFWFIRKRRIEISR